VVAGIRQLFSFEKANSEIFGPKNSERKILMDSLADFKARFYKFPVAAQFAYGAPSCWKETI
jgi:hypothetical protein